MNTTRVLLAKAGLASPAIALLCRASTAVAQQQLPPPLQVSLPRNNSALDGRISAFLLAASAWTPGWPGSPGSPGSPGR